MRPSCYLLLRLASPRVPTRVTDREPFTSVVFLPTYDRRQAPVCIMLPARIQILTLTQITDCSQFNPWPRSQASRVLVHLYSRTERGSSPPFFSQHHSPAPLIE